MATSFSTFFRQFTDEFVHVKGGTITTSDNPVNAPVGLLTTKNIKVSEDISNILPSAGGDFSLGLLYNIENADLLAANQTLHFFFEVITPDTNGNDIAIALVDRATNAEYTGSEHYHYLAEAGDCVYFPFTKASDNELDEYPLVLAGILSGTGDAVIRFSVYYEL